jgi:hypothetical protein
MPAQNRPASPARVERPHYSDHIIEGVMPSLEVHLLTGAPGIGKTSIMLQLLPMIERGERIFGYPSKPTKSVFISCDRSERAHLRRLDSLTIPHYDSESSQAGAFPFYSGLSSDAGYTLDAIVKGCLYQFPDRPLLFIDGMGSLLGESAQYHDVQKFLRTATRLCYEHCRTIIGTVHSPKSKEGQSYSNPREQILGSQAWAGFSDLVIAMAPEKEDSKIKQVWVCTRSSAGDFLLRMIRDSSGKLVEYSDENEKDMLTLLDQWLSKQDFSREIPTKEFLELGIKQFCLSERTIMRWLSAQVDEGKLKKETRGKYLRVRMV